MEHTRKHEVLVGEHQPAVALILSSLAAAMDANLEVVDSRAGLRNAIPLRAPDLILLDKNLPPVNGLACLTELPEKLLNRTLLVDTTSTTTLNVALLQEVFTVRGCLSLPTVPKSVVSYANQLLAYENGHDVDHFYTDPVAVKGGLYASVIASCYFFSFSGILRVQSGNNLRHLHFRKGMPTFVDCSRITERFLTQNLLQQRVINASVQQLREFGPGELAIVDALIENELVSREVFLTLLEEFNSQRIIEMARWRDAQLQLRYLPDAIADDPYDEMNLIELVRKIAWESYTLEVMRAEFPDMTLRHRRIDNPHLPLENFQDDRVILQFYNLLNGLTDLQTILSSQMYTELEAYRMLFILEQFRLVERVNPQDQPTTQRVYESLEQDTNRTVRMDMNEVFQFLDESKAQSLGPDEPSIEPDGVLSRTAPINHPFASPTIENDGVFSSVNLRKNHPDVPTQVEIPAVQSDPTDQHAGVQDQTIRIVEVGLSRFGTFDRLGKYVMLKRLAAGGMGEIHLGGRLSEDGLEEFVAIKKLLAELTDDKSLITMFRDEARVVSQLVHPNIVQFRDFIVERSQYYMVMEYIPGRNMRDMVRAVKKKRRALPIDISLHVIAQVCEGLHYAHESKNQRGDDMRLIHRDINPQNVLLSYDGHVKIIDFGIAKTAIQHTVTLVGQIKGKYSYMSPEQVEGRTLDRRSDIFSLGLVLYQLVTGKKCFNIRNEVELLAAIVDCKFKPPREINPRLPAELEGIVLKCLSKDRDRRYSTTLMLRDALVNFGERYKLTLSQDRLRDFLRDLFEDEYHDEQANLLNYRSAVTLSPDFAQHFGDESTAQDLSEYLESSTAPEIKAPLLPERRTVKAEPLVPPTGPRQSMSPAPAGPGEFGGAPYQAGSAVPGAAPLLPAHHLLGHGQLPQVKGMRKPAQLEREQQSMVTKPDASAKVRDNNSKYIIPAVIFIALSLGIVLFILHHLGVF